jgi:hypothetical protein
MTNELHIAADLDAPIACDMSAAPDTPGERLAEYRRLFARSLLGRERRPDEVVFVLRESAGARVVELARREAECCPFLEYRVETSGDELIWTITNPQRTGARAILDDFFALPDR